VTECLSLMGGKVDRRGSAHVLSGNVRSLEVH
jgi:hypothetical protein